MSIQGGPFSIHDSSLVLSINAANTKSYISGSTNWADLSGNNLNGTLTNGPAFNSSNNGTLQFDGVNDYVSFPTGFISTLTASTFSVWFYWTDNSNWSRVFDFGTGTTYNMFLTPKNGGTGVLRFAITTSSGAGEQQINHVALSLSNWYNVVVTMSGSAGNMYVNGTLVASNNSMTNTPSSLGSTTQNYLGKSQYPDPYFAGNIASLLIYKKALTSSEILQNYNTEKSRFGL